MSGRPSIWCAGQSLCVCCSLLAPFGFSRTAASLFPNPLLAAGTRPVAVATGDFNGDGFVDLAVANRESDDVSVFLGLNATAFTSERRHAVGDSPEATAAADVTGDGRLDLVVANRLSNDVAVLPGLGDGAFGLAINYDVGSEPVHLVAHDFDGSGVADVAVLSWGSADVSVLLAGEDGSLMPPTRYPLAHSVGLNSSFDLTLGDVDDDGMVDLVVSYIAESVSVLLGRPGGAFSPQSALNVPVYNPAAIGLADFNGDGHLDLALAAAADDTLYVLDGNGDASFEPAREIGGVGGLPLDAGAGDFNQDGLPDVVVSSVFSQDGRLAVYLNRGDQGFVSHRLQILGIGRAAESVALEDFDRDGIFDLALASRAGASTLMGLGDGTFGPDLLFETGKNPASQAVAELNQDGIADIVVANAGSDDVSVLPGVGDGRFLPPRRFTSGDGPLAVAVGDFDGDRLNDFAVANGAGGDVVIFQGRGGGHFEISERLPVAGTALVASDLDADNMLDLVVGRQSSSAAILLGRGDGTFEPGAPAEVGSAQGSLGVGDFNRDGLPDLVTAHVFSDDMTVLLGVGAAEFSLPARYPLQEPARSLVVDDLDGDGFEDVALAGCGLTIWKGRGDGSFELPPPALVSLGCTHGITSGDFDLNGVKDLAAANAENSYVSVLLGAGRDLVEFFHLEFMAGEMQSSVAATDLDGDGRRDLSLTDDRFPLGGAVILLNQGPYPNRPPVAVARAEARVECASPSGTPVDLDGSDSFDPDSDSGSGSDIVAYEWFENPGSPTPTLLGSGRVITPILSRGDHEIALRATDSEGATDADVIRVSVVDTLPPALVAGLQPGALWPPDHRMVEVEANVRAVDACSEPLVALMTVSSSESDDAGDMGDGQTTGDIQGVEAGTADFRLRLRAERGGAGAGRVYTVTYRAIDSSGHSTLATSSAVVPHDVAGVTEPLILEARESEAGTVLEWGAIEGAVSYTVMRGDIRNLVVANGVSHLGSSTCIVSDTTQTDTMHRPDSELPAPGGVLFYVARYETPEFSSSYGSASASRERAILEADQICP